MNQSDHTSPFLDEWSNAIQRPGPFYLSSQSVGTAFQKVVAVPNSAIISLTAVFRN